MDFLKRIYYQHRARKSFNKGARMSLATYQATAETLNYMSRSMPIADIRAMLDHLEKCNKSYVSFSELFFESLHKRIPKEKQSFIYSLLKKKNLRSFFLLRKEKKMFLDHVSKVHAAHLAVRAFFNEMTSCIGIKDMEMLIDRAKKDSNKYVNMAEWYIETLQKRKN